MRRARSLAGSGRGAASTLRGAALAFWAVLALFASGIASGVARAEDGRFWMVAGDVVVTRIEAGTERKRRPVGGDPVAAGDRIDTGADGRAQLRFSDGSLVSLQPGSRFSIDAYRFEAGEQLGIWTLSRGALRALSGAIGKRRHDDYKLITPTATVGVRGTEFVVEETVCDPACSPGRSAGLRVAVAEGRVVVITRAGATEVGPGEAVHAPSPDRPAVPTTERPVTTTLAPGGAGTVASALARAGRLLATVPSAESALARASADTSIERAAASTGVPSPDATRALSAGTGAFSAGTGAAVALGDALVLTAALPGDPALHGLVPTLPPSAGSTVPNARRDPDGTLSAAGGAKPPADATGATGVEVAPAGPAPIANAPTDASGSPVPSTTPSTPVPSRPAPPAEPGLAPSVPPVALSPTAPTAPTPPAPPPPNEPPAPSEPPGPLPAIGLSSVRVAASRLHVDLRGPAAPDAATLDHPDARVVLDGARLDAVGVCPGAGCTSRGTQRVADAGGDGLAAWGRWVDGSARTAVLHTADAGAGHTSLHYLVGIPTLTMPTEGAARYAMVGATAPTISDGSRAPGTFIGDAKVFFATGRDTRIAFEGIVRLGDDTRYRFATPGALVTPSATTLTLSGPNTFRTTLPVQADGPGALGCATAGACRASVSGAFLGPDAARLGVGYTVSGTTPGGPTIDGVGVLRRIP